MVVLLWVLNLFENLFDLENKISLPINVYDTYASIVT